MKNQQINLFIFLWGAIFSFVCFYSSLTVLPLYVFDMGGTEFDIGLHMILFFGASILMRFYFGPLTDRKGRKIPLMIGAFAFATSSLLFIICDNVWSMALARIYHAVGLATFFSGGGSLIVDLAPSRRLGLYIGVFRLTFVLALLSGPTLALAIINSYSYTVWFVVSFFIGALSLLLVSLVKTPGYSQKSQESGSLKKFASVLKEKSAYLPLYGIALVSLVYGVLLSFAVLYIDQNSDIANPGFYFTCLSVVAVLGNFFSGYFSDRWGRPLVVWPAIMLLSIGVGVLFFLPDTPSIFFLSSIAAGLGYSGGITSLAAWLVEVTDKESRGTVLALQESVIDLGVGLASFVFGTMSGFFGMGTSFALIGLTVFTLALVKFLSFGSFRQALHHK